MKNLYAPYTDSINFFGKHNPFELLKEYSSPLYVYNEDILRTRCRELKNICKLDSLVISYSSKANSNPALLNIIREEGIWIDAMSPGELCAALAAGYPPEQISYISNNISSEEMLLGAKHSRMIGLDSISQLESFGKICHGGRVMLRVNPGIGAGHHQKVVTAGKQTKFGIDPEAFAEVKIILEKYQLKLVGINQHIGSLFMEPSAYMQAAQWLLEFCETLDLKTLELIDFGGGFGIPYHKHEKQERLDLKSFGETLEKTLNLFTEKTKYSGLFMIEPGRYIPSEAGLILGTVNAVKQNGATIFAGTDIGFSALARPMLYDAYHEIEVFREGASSKAQGELIEQTIVGNICESGDILAKNRKLPALKEGDAIALLDSGAYGYAMSSNYNSRLRPAEVLITSSGELQVIRKRQNLADLFSTQNIAEFPSKFKELLDLSPC